MKRVRTLLGLACLVMAAITAFAFYDRYWIWRDCFNELGRCWDTDTQEVYLEQAGLVWGGMTGLLAMLAAGLLWSAR